MEMQSANKEVDWLLHTTRSEAKSFSAAAIIHGWDDAKWSSGQIVTKKGICNNQ